MTKPVEHQCSALCMRNKIYQVKRWGKGGEPTQRGTNETQEVNLNNKEKRKMAYLGPMP